MDLPKPFLVGEWGDVFTGESPPNEVSPDVRYSVYGSYPNCDWKTLVEVMRPERDGSDPQTALCVVVKSLARLQDQDAVEPWAESKRNQRFHPCILEVAGTVYEGWQLLRRGVDARAVVTGDGWTVLASVPDDREMPAVELAFAVPKSEA